MNNYHNKTEAELKFIIKDAEVQPSAGPLSANEAAARAKDLGNYQAEAKYLDQVNDACSELYRRRNSRNFILKPENI